MTKKDYVLIATALREAVQTTTDPEIREGVMMAGGAIASLLEAENPLFDRGRFARAVMFGPITTYQEKEARLS